MTTNSSESSEVCISSSPSLSVCNTESVLSRLIRGECDSRTFASGIVGLELNPLLLEQERVLMKGCRKKSVGLSRSLGLRIRSEQMRSFNAADVVLGMEG